MPIIGEPVRTARSITLQIFSANASPSEPPSTVKSCEKRKTCRPSIVARPGDHAVAEKLFLVETERVGAVDDEAVELDERSVVDERFDALARGALPALVLLRDGGGPGRRRRLLALLRSSSYFSARLFTRYPFTHQHRKPLSFRAGEGRQRGGTKTAQYATPTASCNCRRVRRRRPRNARRRARRSGIPDTASAPARASGRRNDVRVVGYRSVPVLREHEEPDRRELLQGAERLRARGVGRLGPGRAQFFDRIKELDNAGASVST